MLTMNLAVLWQRGPRRLLRSLYHLDDRDHGIAIVQVADRVTSGTTDRYTVISRGLLKGAQMLLAAGFGHPRRTVGRQQNQGSR